MSDFAVTSLAVKADLFRRDVIVLAGETRADDGLVAQLGRTGDAEIDDLGPRHVAKRDDDVVGRHVAMNDAALVSRLQAGRDAPHQLEQRLERQRPLLQNIRERAAVDEFHGEIRPLQHGSTVKT